MKGIRPDAITSRAHSACGAYGAEVAEVAEDACGSVTKS